MIVHLFGLRWELRQLDRTTPGAEADFVSDEVSGYRLTATRWHDLFDLYLEADQEIVAHGGGPTPEAAAATLDRNLDGLRALIGGGGK